MIDISKMLDWSGNFNLSGLVVAHIPGFFRGIKLNRDNTRAIITGYNSKLKNIFSYFL